MAEVESRHRFDAARITGSSGGALSAAAWIADREGDLRDRFRHSLERQDVNITVGDLDECDGRSPHQRIYAEIVRDVIDARAMAAIADGPAFQISVSTPGSGIGATAKALAAGTIYQAEQIVSPTPRPRLSAIAGVEQRLIDARQAARDGTLPDLIRMAATVPPAFRPDEWGGEPVFDGGMVDKAPLPEPDRGRTLVLLTKRFHSLPDDDGGRIEYVSPGDDVLSGSKLDFTDPDLLQQAWRRGREDGRRWLGARD